MPRREQSTQAMRNFADQDIRPLEKRSLTSRHCSRRLVHRLLPPSFAKNFEHCSRLSCGLSDHIRSHHRGRGFAYGAARTLKRHIPRAAVVNAQVKLYLVTAHRVMSINRSGFSIPRKFCGSLLWSRITAWYTLSDLGITNLLAAS